MSITLDMIAKPTVASMVGTYKDSVVKINQALALLKSAITQAEAVFGPNIHFVPSNGWCEFAFKDDKTAKTAEKKLARDAWLNIIRTTGLDKVMIPEKYEAWRKQIEHGDVPELTEENINALLEQYVGNAHKLLEEHAIHVFESLRPGWREELKTNLKNEWSITQKFILHGVMDGYGVNYYRRNMIGSLDTVFHLLDGKGIPKYPDDLLTVVSNAFSMRLSHCETPYFRLKWYKNGNAHFECLRADLLQELNRIAGVSVQLGKSRK